MQALEENVRIAIKILMRGGLTVLVVALLQWSAALDLVGLDDLVERQLLAFAQFTVDRAESDNIRLIYINEQGNGSLGDFKEATQRQEWRSRHAQLLLKLNQAGARVVAFDLVFPHPIEQHLQATEELRNAVAEVKAAGNTHVILGYDKAADTDRELLDICCASDADQAQGVGKVGIARSMSQGNNARAVTDVLMAEVNFGIAKRGNRPQKVQWPQPMTQTLLRAALNPPSPTEFTGPVIDRFREELTIGRPGIEKTFKVETRKCTDQSLNCPLAPDADEHWYAFLPVWMGASGGFVERSYASVVGQPSLSEDYRGKIVIVGARVSEEKLSVASSNGSASAWGYQVYARVLADLLSDTYLRRPSLWLFWGVLVLAVCIGALARRFFKGLKVDVSVPWIGNQTLPLALFICLLADAYLALEHLRQAHVLHPIVYHWLAAIGGYYFVHSNPRTTEDRA